MALYPSCWRTPCGAFRTDDAGCGSITAGNVIIIQNAERGGVSWGFFEFAGRGVPLTLII
jgi:hypothetical protein